MSTQRSKLTRLLKPLLISLCMTTLSVQAASPSVDDSTTMAFAPPVSLRQAVDAAVALLPEHGLGSAYTDHAQALSQQSRSWLAAAPLVSLGLQNDRLNNDIGYQEVELALELPLKRFAQASWDKQLSAVSEQQAHVWQQAQRLIAAGQVRNTIWDYTAAVSKTGLTRKALEIAEGIEAKLERMVELGEDAAFDLLAARQDRLQKTLDWQQAKADEKASLEAYQVLTQLPTPPNNALEANPEKPPATTNALLRLAQLNARYAQAIAQRTQSSLGGQPSLSLRARQERSDRGSHTDQFTGIGLTLPLGGKQLLASDYTAALKEAAQAKSEYLVLQRKLRLAEQRTREQLQALQVGLPLAQQALAAAKERWRMAQLAYDHGALSFIELLRAQNTWLEAQQSDAATRLAIGKAQAELNQILGVTP